MHRHLFFLHWEKHAGYFNVQDIMKIEVVKVDDTLETRDFLRVFCFVKYLSFSVTVEYVFCLEKSKEKTFVIVTLTVTLLY